MIDRSRLVHNLKASRHVSSQPVGWPPARLVRAPAGPMAPVNWLTERLGPNRDAEPREVVADVSWPDRGAIWYSAMPAGR